MRTIQKLLKEIKRNQEVLFTVAREFEQKLSLWEKENSVVSYSEGKKILKKHNEVFKLIENTQDAINRIVEEMEIIKNKMDPKNEEEEECLSRFVVVTDYYILICDKFQKNFKTSYDKFSKHLKPGPDIKSLIDIYHI